jgi:hypothetical protein
LIIQSDNQEFIPASVDLKGTVISSSGVVLFDRGINNQIAVSRSRPG